MDRDSVQRLRFDRRLQQRNGWMEEDERQAYLDSLPDVTEKMTTIADAEESANAAEAAPAASSGQTFGATPPAGTAGNFSTPSGFGGFRDESGSN